MNHLRVISRAPTPSKGETTPVETLVLLVLGIYFQEWDNFMPVIRNLSKFYQKT